MATRLPFCLVIFFFNDTATTEIYTLSLHDALPIFLRFVNPGFESGSTASQMSVSTGPGETSVVRTPVFAVSCRIRSEEHTSELQSPCNLVCRLLLEKKKIKKLNIRDRC